jgi:hypothetical protein
MVPLLTLLYACASDPVPAAAPPTVDETVAAVRAGLSDAHRHWSAGDSAEASALVLSTYHKSFEQLEPALRAQNPRETLEMEYAFSVLANHLSKKGNPVDIASEVRSLTGRVETAAAAIPRAPGQVKPPEQPQTSATVAVPVSEARGADAPGVTTAKPDDD